jgi:hypothetical protein
VIAHYAVTFVRRRFARNLHGGFSILSPGGWAPVIARSVMTETNLAKNIERHDSASGASPNLGALSMTQTHTMAAGWSAAAAKLAMILDALRQDFITPADRAAMERCIAYYRRRAAGARENFKAEAAVNKFCERHGFSLDWLYDPAVTVA